MRAAPRHTEENAAPKDKHSKPAGDAGLGGEKRRWAVGPCLPALPLVWCYPAASQPAFTFAEPLGTSAMFRVSPHGLRLRHSR